MIYIVLFLFAFANTLTPEPVVQLSTLETVRSLSLQLRGVVPSVEEMEQIEYLGGIDEALLDQWLSSEAFEEQVVRHHQSLFWNSTFANDFEIRRLVFYSDGVFFRKFTSQYNRGLSRVQCSDWENTDVTEWNQPLTTQTETVNLAGQDVSYIDEGWVWVTPYWSDDQIKVCAFDAQTNLFNDDGVDCSNSDSNKVAGCGCGPNLKWCMNRTIQNVFKQSFVDEINERVRNVVSEEKPYSNILTDQTMYFNGPLAFYYENIDPFISRTSAPTDNIPQLDYSDIDTWVNVETGPLYSGALTSPGWLLRHQTNRGRANRFYEAFLCSTFVPPVGGIVDEANSTPDLSLKQGCAECHTRLEPWRAYWGRWGEVSSAYITEEEFPSFSQTCKDCVELGNCNYTCRNNYMVDPTHIDDNPYIGWYLPYVYLKAEQRYFPDEGPSTWVQEVASNGALSQCVTKNTALWIFGWENDEIDPDLLEEWSTSFDQSGQNYRNLVREMVTHPAYGWRK